MVNYHDGVSRIHQTTLQKLGSIVNPVMAAASDPPIFAGKAAKFTKTPSLSHTFSEVRLWAEVPETFSRSRNHYPRPRSADARRPEDPAAMRRPFRAAAASSIPHSEGLAGADDKLTHPRAERTGNALTEIPEKKRFYQRVP